VLILKIIFFKKKTLKKQTYNSLHKRTKNKEMSCQNTQEIAMNCLNQIQNDRMESKVITDPAIIMELKAIKDVHLSHHPSIKHF